MAHIPATALGVGSNLAAAPGSEPGEATGQLADPPVPVLEEADLTADITGPPIEPVVIDGDPLGVGLTVGSPTPPPAPSSALRNPSAPLPVRLAAPTTGVGAPPVIRLAGSVTRTDVGRQRDHNEDTVLANDDLGLYIVADGMGGHAAGEVAAGIAVTTVTGHVRDNHDPPHVGKMLTAAVRAADQAIKSAAKANANKKGMATTIVVLYLNGTTATLAHVGDSRIYRLRQGHLEQLTRDHTLFQTLIDVYGKTPAEAAKSPYRDALTRSVGDAESAEEEFDEEEALELEVDVTPLEMQAGDRFLLCSDGLTRECGHDEIQRILSRERDPNAAASALINAANDHSGRDNISVVIVDIV